MTQSSSYPETFLALHEIVQKARQKLNHDNWDYIIGGTETETTVHRNRAALEMLAFKPRVLRNVSEVDTSTQFLGRKLRLPLMLAPVGSLELFSPDSAVAAARAAHTFGIAHMLSSVSLVNFEQVAKEVPQALRLYQLYVHGDAAWVDDLVERTEQAGCSAFCLTVDSAYYSRRERDIAKRNIRRTNVPGREFQPTLTWDDVDRVKSKLKIPLILKGIATAEDARLAVEHGVDMVYISNHGGRQLDFDRGTMDMLPEIVDAVEQKAKIIIDGGFNRGTDIVKAIACGADMVGLGRMQCFGLAADGAQGVVRMLELLETEVRTAMGLLGVTKLSDLSRAHVCKAAPASQSHVLSAFPHLSLEDKAFY
jgi:isopentenyl diphosphate isomerase/L-lactate dehydrogenase-like FMN-dependent dehydrogenase